MVKGFEIEGVIHKYDYNSLDNLPGFVTPEMYGAKGDGITDDTNAFKNAVNSGKPVYVPNGIYVLSDNIELKAGVTIFGSGAHGVENDGGYVNTLLRFSGGNGFVVKGNHVTIRDMRIAGSGAGNGIATELMTDSDTPTISKIVISNLWMTGFDVAINMNIYLSDISMVNVYNCTKGFRFIRGTSIKLYGCYASSCDYGFEIGAVYSTMINCACDHASECCYMFTKDSKTVLCLGLGAEDFAKKLVNVTMAYDIIIDGLLFYTDTNAETDGIIYLNNAKYTVLRNVFDRRITSNNSSVQKYLFVNYGLANRIESSNIVNEISKTDLTLGGTVKNKMVMQLLTNNNSDDGVTFSVTGSQLVSKLFPALYSYDYDGIVTFDVTDLTGNIGYNTNRILESANRMKRVVITSSDATKNIFDTGENWTTIRNCETVVEFKNLVILPYSLPSTTRPYFNIKNAKVIFTNCDFSQTNSQGRQSQNMVKCTECATVIFNNCTLPNDQSKLYTKDASCTVLGV